MTIDPDPDTDLVPPPRVPASSVDSVLGRLSLPLGVGVLVILGCINGIGAWPAFRQQDTSVLHWILASNSEALRGISHEEKSEGSDPLKDLMKSLKGYLTLENMNLSGLNLSSSDLGDMSIENVNFSGARLVSADFSCSDLTNVNFGGAKLMHAKFDYSDCKDHISTRRPHCSKIDRDEVNYAKSPFGWPKKITCLEGRFVGADFSDAQIRGDKGRRFLSDDKHYCSQLLVLVGDMSGASFKNAMFTCVALIHRPASATPVSLAFPTLLQLQRWLPWLTNSGEPSRNQPDNKMGKVNDQFVTFNGIRFEEARLDRVALLKGPFRFSQFERTKLMGLFVNINPDKVDLDYSRFNEVQCEAPRSQAFSESPAKPITYWPCLLVKQDKRNGTRALRLNFLWSTLVTNLKPSDKDKFLCTPNKDLPARIEDKWIEIASYWLSPTGWPTADREQLNCPVDSKEAKEPEPLQQSHVLSPRKTVK